MAVLKPREDFPNRSVEPLQERRKREAEEAAQARCDYIDGQRRVLERMFELRRERLTRLAKSQE